VGHHEREVRDKKLPAEVLEKIMPSFTFKEGKYSSMIMGKQDEAGSYTIDAKKKPAHIDLMVEEGKDKGKTQLGLIAVEGDVLKMALAKPGEKDRPKDFEGGADIIVASFQAYQIAAETHRRPAPSPCSGESPARMTLGVARDLAWSNRQARGDPHANQRSDFSVCRCGTRDLGVYPAIPRRLRVGALSPFERSEFPGEVMDDAVATVGLAKGPSKDRALPQATTALL
jgi:uncharacterized protein (TIGR03067 family)